MTATEGMEMFDRMKRAGYRMPLGVEETGVFNEWFAALKGYDVDTVSDGITRLVSERKHSSWPTVAEVLELVREVSRRRVAARDQSQQFVIDDPVSPEWFQNWLAETKARVMAKCAKPMPKVSRVVEFRARQSQEEIS